MLDDELDHREIVDVGGGKAGADPRCRSGDQAVGLMQRYAARCERTSLSPGKHSFGRAEGY